MNQINKIRIVEVDPETRDQITTEFADVDAAIEYLRGKQVKSVETEETTDGREHTTE